MSKHKSAPISDFFSRSFARAKRSRRRRSKSTRCSQSTAIDPYVGRAIKFSLTLRSEVRGQIAEVEVVRRRFQPLQSDLSPLTSLTVRRVCGLPRRPFARLARLHLPKAAKMELEHASRPSALRVRPDRRMRLWQSPTQVRR